MNCHLTFINKKEFIWLNMIITQKRIDTSF
jgi:hypothetical protein